MRILWVSDSPLAPSSYGTQTRLLVPRLLAAGHEVAVFGATYVGTTMEVDGITVYGGLGTNDPADMIINYAARFRADAVVTFKDPYVYSGYTLRGLPCAWVPVVPVDTEPLDLVTKAKLSYATAPLAIARAGQEAMATEGIGAAYTPLGVDMGFWTPGDRAAARARLHLDPDAFVALFVGANQSAPSRKNIDQIVLTWAQAVTQLPAFRDAVLWLHTSLTDIHGGIHIERLLDHCGISPHHWRVTDPLLYESGAVKADFLRDLYRAADVLLLPSGGEGFGLPLVEAQACGCPVIACDWTAMRETARVGWRIPVTGGETTWHPRGGFWFRPARRALLNALQAAEAKRGDASVASLARQAVAGYDVDRVMAEHWLPALARIEALLDGADLGVPVTAETAEVAA